MRFDGIDFESEVDRQRVFDRRFILLGDLFVSNEGEFVAILDRKFDRLYFVSRHSADEICELLNNLYGESLSYLGTVSCDAE